MVALALRFVTFGALPGAFDAGLLEDGGAAADLSHADTEARDTDLPVSAVRISAIALDPCSARASSCARVSNDGVTSVPMAHPHR